MRPLERDCSDQVGSASQLMRVTSAAAYNLRRSGNTQITQPPVLMSAEGTAHEGAPRLLMYSCSLRCRFFVAHTPLRP